MSRGLRGPKPKTKWKDGQPHLDYWGGGHIANLTHIPDPHNRRVYEIYPVKDRSGRIDSTIMARSLEIWKAPKTSEISIIATADAMDESFPAELGHDTEKSFISLPDWVHDDEYGTLRGFDIELSNQLNFTTLARDIPHILNIFASKISANTNAGICLQAIFQDMTHTFVPILCKTQKAMKKPILKKPTTETDYTIIMANQAWQAYEERLAGVMVGLSIRGVIRAHNHTSAVLAIKSAASNIGMNFDSVHALWYDNEYESQMLEWLKSRQLCSKAALDLLENNSHMWDDLRWGIGRDTVPLLVLNPKELASLIQIPDDLTLALKYKRQRRGGAEPARTGFALDSQEYGALLDSPAALDPHSLLMHTYVLGATGCGKSSLLRSILKHLEMANARGTFQSASIFIDVKDRDSIDCYCQCEDKADVEYIDINGAGFALNLLELPRYAPDDRDATVSRTVGHIIGALKEIYSQHQTFVQLERVMRLLLHYLYSNTDNPTMLDLYALIIKLQTGDKSTLERIFQVYNKYAVPEMETSIRALKSMPRDSWTALINRIEPFVIEGFLRGRFATERTTIDFEAMLKPNKITIVRIAEADTPAHAHRLVATIMVMRIWAAVMARQKRGGKITPVVLFLDEFQSMAGMETVRTMLSRARSFGLGLVLAHQNLGQIPDSLLDTIAGNTSAQIYGRISGTSASKIARMIEPADAMGLAERLSSQPNYSFTYSSMPEAGCERDVPSSMGASPPPRLLREPPISKKTIPVGESVSLERKLVSSPEKWKNHIVVHLPTRDEWKIMLALRHDELSITDLAMCAGIMHRDMAKEAVDSLLKQGFVSTRRGKTRGIPVLCSLTFKAKGAYFSGMWSAIGTASDIAHVASTAFEYYVNKEMFVTTAMQGGRGGGTMNTDLVAYDYESGLATSVEIESNIQARTHPEHVIHNMKKWPDMGFAKCDVWSMLGDIIDLRRYLDEKIAKKVTCFVIDKKSCIVEQSQ